MSNELEVVRTRAARSLRGSLRTGIVTCMLVVSASAMAQEGNRDYYKANQSREEAQLLRNAEQYHIGPGIERMNSRNYGGAYEDFVFILRFFPNHPRALALISELCDLKWKSPRCEVEDWFQRAIARNPDASPTYLVYGLHLQRLNRLPEAIESYKKAISLDPGSVNAHYNLGLAYFAAKQYDLANREAQLSYALGVSLPGLRDMLTRAGQWKPLDPEELKRQLQAKPEATNEVKTQ